MDSTYIALSVIMLVITYTGTLIGCLSWLSNKFNTLDSAIAAHVPQVVYETKIAVLEARMRDLELQVAKNTKQ